MFDTLPLVVIIGRPNVGKSSLFNRLVGQPQAIVAKEEHTTRASVDALVKYQGRSFYLIDTAGIGKLLATNPAERQLLGTIQSQIALIKDSADAIIVVVDGSHTLTQTDHQIAKAALKTGQSVILAVNKMDRPNQSLPPTVQQLGIKRIIPTSAIHNLGVTELKEMLATLLPKRPTPSGPGPTGLAIVGRPNLGKSTLFNALGQTETAVVSDVAGTTRDVKSVNITIGHSAYRLFDTGGVRRPGKRQGIEHFSYLRTLWAINHADIVILLIDPLEPSGLDTKLAGLIKDMGKGLVVAVNKWDLVTNKAHTQALVEQRLTQQLALAWWAPVVFVSAITRSNLTKLLEMVELANRRRQEILPAHELSHWLTQTIARHPPAGLKNHQPKLTSIVQSGSEPPQITISGRQTDWLHWSYKRYLENQLRRQFNLIGTPITLEFRDNT